MQHVSYSSTSAQWKIDLESEPADPGARGTSGLRSLPRLASEAVNEFCLPRLRLGKSERLFSARRGFLKSRPSET